MKSFLLFDVETRIDKSLVNMTQYPNEGMSDEEAYIRYRAMLKAERGSDFMPIVYHIPISIAVGHVDAQYQLMAVQSLGSLGLNAKAIAAEVLMVEEFWRLANAGHTLVTFNGRGFDLPVLELAALRHGIQAPRYWGDKYGPRYRYQDDKHIDVADVLCNNGAVPRMRLNDLLIMLGYAGKGEVDGSKVQQMWEDGKLDEIDAYCRRDVMSTFSLWLRLELIRGKISPEAYATACASAEPWLRSQP